jgi:hypothetical protein
MRTKKEMDTQFAAAREDYLSWEQMFNALDVRRKMIDSEVKIAKDIQAILTAEDGYELIAKITGVIIQVVNDPNQLKRIQYEITRLIGDTPIGKDEPINGEFNEGEE